MKPLATLAALTLLISSSLSAILPRNTDPREISVTQLALLFPSEQGNDTNVTLTFDVSDAGETNGSGIGNATCTASWIAGSQGWPQDQSQVSSGIRLAIDRSSCKTGFV
jgi:hypothetical protein